MPSDFRVGIYLEELAEKIEQLEKLNDELRPGGDKMDEYNSGYRAGLYTARYIIGKYHEKIFHGGMDYEREEKDAQTTSSDS